MVLAWVWLLSPGPISGAGVVAKSHRGHYCLYKQNYFALQTKSYLKLNMPGASLVTAGRWHQGAQRLPCSPPSLHEPQTNLQSPFEK